MIRMVCYDITETKARTKLVNLLEHLGFDRIQYSVFVGKIASEKWPKCWKGIEKFYAKNCNTETDRIYSHIIDQDNFKKMSTLGKGPNSAWILHEINVLFI